MFLHRRKVQTLVESEPKPSKACNKNKHRLGSFSHSLRLCGQKEQRACLQTLYSFGYRTADMVAVKTHCKVVLVVNHGQVLRDCGPGTPGVTFGLLIIRALFCPHLDTTKTPTETNVQEPNRARFKRKSRAGLYRGDINIGDISPVRFENQGGRGGHKNDL